MTIRRFVGVTAAALAAGLAYANFETRWFEVKHVRVPVLPPGEPDIRVLQLADLHYLPSQRTKTKWLKSLGELRPDLVVDTGDNVSSRASIPALLDVLRASGLLDVPGVFVGGSNDYFAPILKNPARYLSRKNQIPFDLPPLPWEELFGGFEQAGWVNLNNRRAQVKLRSGQVLDFVGTDDAHHNRDGFPAQPAAMPKPEVEESQSNVTKPTAHTNRHSARALIGSQSQNLEVAAGDSGFRDAATCAQHDGRGVVARIGVTHAPYQRVLQQLKDDGVALVMAGHTHGGQLRIPGYGAIVTNCDLDRKRAEGLHGWPGNRPDAQASVPVGVAVAGSAPESQPIGGSFAAPSTGLRHDGESIWLYVSAGAGTSPYTPFRFDCRPSATLLTLTAKP